MTARLRGLCRALLVLGLLVSSTRGEAEDAQCTSAASIASIVTCGASTGNRPKSAGAFVPVAPAPRARSSSSRSAGVRKPAVEIDLAALVGRPELARRARELLERELTVLQRLAKNTPRNSKR